MDHADQRSRLGHAVTLHNAKALLMPKSFGARRQCRSTRNECPKLPTESAMQPTSAPDSPDEPSLRAVAAILFQLVLDFLHQALKKPGYQDCDRNALCLNRCD